MCQFFVSLWKTTEAVELCVTVLCCFVVLKGTFCVNKAILVAVFIFIIEVFFVCCFFLFL